MPKQTNPVSLITDNINIWSSAIQNKKGVGRGGSKKINLYGIKKLRELILDLAVRGLLVEQDSNDEPASVLLGRIEIEKEQLLKENKIKKVKVPSDIEKSEKAYKLPKSWSWAYFPDVCHYGPGRTPATKNVLFWGDESEGVPWVSIADMSHYQTLETTTKFISKKAAEEVFKYEPIKAGTLLMSFKLTLGKISKLGIDAYHNEAIISIYPFSGIDGNFIYRFLPSRALAGKSKKAIKGNTLNSESLAALLLPIPPLAEQNRIVTKVNELMTLCDQLEQQQENSITAHKTLVETLLAALTNAANKGDFDQAWKKIADHFDTLFTTEHSIDQLKQTILQLAVMGKLVPQNPKDEPASVLLEKIAVEKERLVKEKKIKKQKELPEITDDEKEFDLPKGWEWCRIWDVAEIITSGSRDWAKYYSDTGAIFVTMGNLSRGDYALRLDTIRYVEPPKSGEGLRTSLKENDLLISITGDVGNLGLIPANFGEAYINQHTCLLRFMSKSRNRYFAEFMRSPFAMYQFNAPQRGIKNSFRLGDVGEMIIPIPPMKEQSRIVKVLDNLMLLLSGIKKEISISKTMQVNISEAVSEKIIS